MLTEERGIQGWAPPRWAYLLPGSGSSPTREFSIFLPHIRARKSHVWLHRPTHRRCSCRLLHVLLQLKIIIARCRNHPLYHITYDGQCETWRGWSDEFTYVLQIIHGELQKHEHGLGWHLQIFDANVVHWRWQSPNLQRPAKWPPNLTS
jgi:hypothetical protein